MEKDCGKENREDYYPFGLTFNSYNRENSVPNKYLFNGKENIADLGLNVYDFGWREFDPAIGRWSVVDPLADKRHWLSPYNFVQDNPINNFDPNGLTDYTLNKESGEVTRKSGDKNESDKEDRILKTDKNGNVKKKGEGFLGFLVRQSHRGEAKTAIGGVQTGILSNGMNLKTKDYAIKVGGEGQPTKEGVHDFALKLSNYIDKEVSGFDLAAKGKDDISHVYLGHYSKNDSQNSFSALMLPGFAPNQVDVLRDWHTHLSRFGDSDRLVPSGLQLPGGDVAYKAGQRSNMPRAKFTVITNPEPFDY